MAPPMIQLYHNSKVHSNRLSIKVSYTRAQIADGCVIMPYAVVNTGTVLNKACIVNVGALVDHDCILEEGCHIAPGGIVKGENHLRKGTKVDSGEVVPLQFYR